MMENLPIELVLEIFEQLSERELCLVSLVSSQWYQWTLIPSLWKAFFVRCHPYAAKQDVIWPILSDQEFREFIQRRMRNLQSLPVTKLAHVIPLLGQAQVTTSFAAISLHAIGGSSLSRICKMLADEAGTASGIRSRVGRLSFLTAVALAQQRLKLYSSIPPSGLLLYSGTILTEKLTERKVAVDLVGPTWKGKNLINSPLYLVDSSFHFENVKTALAPALKDIRTYQRKEIQRITAIYELNPKRVICEDIQSIVTQMMHGRVEAIFYVVNAEFMRATYSTNYVDYPNVEGSYESRHDLSKMPFSWKVETVEDLVAYFVRESEDQPFLNFYMLFSSKLCLAEGETLSTEDVAFDGELDAFFNKFGFFVALLFSPRQVEGD